MATGARISTLGLYSYDPTLFSKMELPEEIDRDSFINYLLLQTSELPLLYGDADFMKNMIGVWSANRIGAWERMARVLYEDYDPFINIRRDEERTETETRDLTTHGESSSNTRNDVNAWEQEQSPTTGSNTTGSSLIGNTGTITRHETYHLEGDSAITDAQDVARKDIQMRQQFNLINIIINEFKSEFCLNIY